MLLPTPGISPSVNINNLLCTLSNDDIARVVKSDKLILKFAEKLYLKHGHDRDQFPPVRNSLREAGRLLIELRKVVKKPDAGLEEFIDPMHFQLVVEAVHGIAGFDLSSHKMATPSLALKVGHTLKKCAKIIKGFALQVGDKITIEKAQGFIELLEMEWTERVSTHALRTMGENKRNKVQLIPLTNDCVKLTKWLREKAAKAYLDVEMPTNTVSGTSAAWCELSDTLLSTVILFNRRRQGEVSRMKLADFVQTHQSRQEDIMKAFSPFEQKLCKALHRIEIVGKRGRTVPVLLTADMHNWMKKVVCCETRSIVGVNQANFYIFAARHGSLGHLRGTDTLSEHSSKCGAKHPELIRSTRLRKQVATLSQILNLKDNELDILANFLGHDVRIHRDFYRLPEDSLQVAKVSKILVASEQGTLASYHGKSLDEMDVDIDEVISFEEESDAEGEDEVDDIGSADVDVSVTTATGAGTSAKSSASTSGPSTPTEDKSGQKKAKPVPWTDEQRQAVRHYFTQHIALGKCPSKREVEGCQTEEPCLKKRAWRNIKDFVRNDIVKAKRKKSLF
ncbi:uncharacterized protein LOC135488255 [Lineus longissimus]|uniref:uncharacterized protein LOC135488255 n=1 Tax=Lineus longissimus TaxID=88925 RepID=UPI002B4C7D96